MAKTLKIATGLALVMSLAACSNKSQQSGAADSSGSQSIVGGSDVGENDITAVSTVGLVFNMKGPDGKEGQAVCTGTLVAQDIVLTAAHCLGGASAGLVIFAADMEKASQDQVRPIILADVNPNYKAGARTNRSDLALVKFKGDLPAGYQVAQIGTAAMLKNGAKVLLAGYGANSMTPGQPDGAAVLRKTTVVLTKADYSDAEMYFAQYKGAGACHGDSGGPAYIKKGKNLFLIGVTSTSATPEGGSTCMEGSLYEKVPAFADYIQSTIQAMENASDAQASN